MHTVLRAGEQRRSRGGTLTFEGEPHGSGVSFFLVDSEPGAGPGLHGIPTRRPGSSAPGTRASPPTARRSTPAPGTSSSSAPRRRTSS